MASLAGVRSDHSYELLIFCSPWCFELALWDFVLAKPGLLILRH